MAKRRPSGDGMVRKRDDGRWEGRIVVGHKENGDSIFRYVYAPTQKELSTKLRQNIDAYQGVDLTSVSDIAVVIIHTLGHQPDTQSKAQHETADDTWLRAEAGSRPCR